MLEVRLERSAHRGGTGLWIFHHETGRPSRIVTPMTMTLQEIPEGASIEPSLFFSDPAGGKEFLQGLSDGLIECGYRPRPDGAERELKATLLRADQLTRILDQVLPTALAIGRRRGR